MPSRKTKPKKKTAVRKPAVRAGKAGVKAKGVSAGKAKARVLPKKSVKVKAKSKGASKAKGAIRSTREKKAAVPTSTGRPVAKKVAAGASPSPVVKPEPALLLAVAPPEQTESMAVRARKVAIRKEIREGLRKMRERARRSKAICDAIISHPTWRRSTIVAIFAPLEHEPDVELLWKYVDTKTICYPTIRQGGLDFIGVAGPESVTLGEYGFREPIFDQARVIPPDTFDLVLVPGAAFTANGERLGRGGGFYDRLLSSPGFRAFKVGVCFDRQIVPEIPMEPHDQRVHRVVTESGWLQRPDFVKKGGGKGVQRPTSNIERPTPK